MDEMQPSVEVMGLPKLFLIKRDPQRMEKYLGSKFE